ncbi:MAG: diacylglycerol kinase [Myxococcales bacterium]|nr:diacylglycerol kinase [Myxococcales bacterium]
MRVEVVLNANARRGSQAVLRELQRALPAANILRTSSVEDVEVLASSFVQNPPDLVLSAGGDGSALALVNAAFRARQRLGKSRSGPLLRIGLLRLGTGNGWAWSSGAPRFGFGLKRLSEFVDRGGRGSELPLLKFDLLETEGFLSHFAGTGWDAELIDDYHGQRTEPGVLPSWARQGLPGYLNGLFTRAVPRNLKLPRVEVEVKNTGSPALGVDSRGRAFDLSSDPADNVLYRGPVSVCGVGTSPQWGFGFRAFPFARLVPGRFNLRMFVGTTTEALARIPLLWVGRHPLPNMLTWMLDRCSVTFSRPVPFQAGGDLLGHRDRIDYALSGETVEVLDWRAFGRLVGAPERLLKDVIAGQLEPALIRSGIPV